MSASGNRPIIRSLSNPQVKRVVRLRNASERRKSGLFLIDGVREIRMALDNGIKLEMLFFTECFAELDMLAADVLQPVTEQILTRISYGDLSNSPVAVAKTPTFSLSSIPQVSQSLWLVLDRTEKPGNLGACIRTASATGVGAVILTNPICEVFNPNTIRASRGAVFTLPIAIGSPQEIVTLCEQRDICLYCSRTDAMGSIWECDFTGNIAVVFGNEAGGLGIDWTVSEAKAFRIPMKGEVDSLNLSISAAVTLFEAVRQRNRI